MYRLRSLLTTRHQDIAPFSPPAARKPKLVLVPTAYRSFPFGGAQLWLGALPQGATTNIPVSLLGTNRRTSIAMPP